MHNPTIYFNTNNHSYLSRHPEIERFYMPKTFYFRYLPDRLEIHWAIIKPADGYVNVYFINHLGRVFDKLEFKSVKIARRRLRKCGFDFSTNKYCKETPREPIYIQLSEGKKSAPYSKGNLFQSVQRKRGNSNKYKKSYYKGLDTLKRYKGPRIFKYTKKPEIIGYDSFGWSLLIMLLIFFIITLILTTMAGW